MLIVPVVGFLRTLYRVLRDAIEAYSRKGDSMLGGAIAFYVMLSAAPLLVIAVGVAGLVFGMDEARTEVLVNARRFLGPDAAQYLLGIMRAAREPLAGGVAAGMSVVVILFGATRLFLHLQRTLNYVVGVRVKPAAGIKRVATDILKQRAKSFAMVLGCGILLTILVLVRTGVSALDALLDPNDRLPWFWHVLELSLSFSLLAALLAAIYKVIPDVHLGWRDVWLGGAITAILLGLGTLPIGWFLGRAGKVSAYGPASALVVVLLFVYYSSQIFFLGAEITVAWARCCGRGIRPKSYATRLVEETDIPPPR